MLENDAPILALRVMPPGVPARFPGCEAGPQPPHVAARVQCGIFLGQPVEIFRGARSDLLYRPLERFGLVKVPVLPKDDGLGFCFLQNLF
jgi:hypothetical protein